MVPKATLGFLLLLVGCQGQIGAPGENTINGGDGDDGVTNPDEDIAFSVGDQQPQVLPFWVRMDRVAALVGRPTTDPMFDVMRANRYALGDYNHGANTKPDRLWSARMMTEWVKALRPICSSPEMAAIYPKLGTDPTQLVTFASDAYGRDVRADEVAFTSASFDALPEAGQAELACISVLTSAEFVVQ